MKRFVCQAIKNNGYVETCIQVTPLLMHLRVTSLLYQPVEKAKSNVKYYSSASVSFKTTSSISQGPLCHVHSCPWHLLEAGQC